MDTDGQSASLLQSVAEGINPRGISEGEDADTEWGNLRRVVVALSVFFLFSFLSWVVPLAFKILLFKVFCLKEVHQAASGIHVYMEIRDVCGRLSNCRTGADLWEAGQIEIPGYHRSPRKKPHCRGAAASKLYLPDRRLTAGKRCQLEGGPYDDLGELFDGRIRSYYVTFWCTLIGMCIFWGGVILALLILKVRVYSLLASMGFLALVGAILVKDMVSNFFYGLCIMKNNLVERGDYVKLSAHEGWVVLVKSTHTTMYSVCDTKCSDGTQVRCEFVEVPNMYFFAQPFKILTRGWDWNCGGRSVHLV